MNDPEFDSYVELWRGESSASLGDLNPRYLRKAEAGTVLGRFRTPGRHAGMRIAVIGYPVEDARRYGAYAVIRASVSPNDQASRIDVYPGKEYTGGLLVLGALALEPVGSMRPPRLGTQYLVPENPNF